jgi:hypothetical protein
MYIAFWAIYSIFGMAIFAASYGVVVSILFLVQKISGAGAQLGWLDIFQCAVGDVCQFGAHALALAPASSLKIMLWGGTVVLFALCVFVLPRIYYRHWLSRKPQQQGAWARLAVSPHGRTPRRHLSF